MNAAGTQATAQIQPLDVHGALESKRVPKIWLPDFSLKLKLGKNIRLDQLITDSVIAQAQAAIDSISDQSLEWIRDDLKALNAQITMMMQGQGSLAAGDRMAEQALSIHTRAGTFGYACASEIAYLMYLFCRLHLDTENAGHRLVAQKHAEVLQVVLGHQMRGTGGKIGEQMVSELRKLAENTQANAGVVQW